MRRLLREAPGGAFHVQISVSEMRRLLHEVPGGPFHVQILVSEMRRLLREAPGGPFHVQTLQDLKKTRPRQELKTLQDSAIADKCCPRIARILCFWIFSSLFPETGSWGPGLDAPKLKIAWERTENK